MVGARHLRDRFVQIRIERAARSGNRFRFVFVEDYFELLECHLDPFGQLFKLAAADQKTRIDLAESGAQFASHLCTCRYGERMKLLLFFRGRDGAYLDVHQNGALTMTRTVKQV